MLRNIVVIFAVFVSIQCQMYTLPYPRPCACGAPALPTIMPPNPQCGSPVPLPRPIIAAPCEAPMPVAVKMPVQLPCEAPLPYAVPNVIAKPACGCSELPLAGLPFGLPFGNPFLPAASPVSALALSSVLPAPSTCSRCQYLKKIPIPPPCI